MFKDLHGKTLILHGIPVTWTVKQLRYKLGVEKHLSDQVEDYRFIYNGKQLVDGKIYQLKDFTLLIVQSGKQAGVISTY